MLWLSYEFASMIIALNAAEPKYGTTPLGRHALKTCMVLVQEALLAQVAALVRDFAKGRSEQVDAAAGAMKGQLQNGQSAVQTTFGQLEAHRLRAITELKVHRSSVAGCTSVAFSSTRPLVSTSTMTDSSSFVVQHNYAPNPATSS